MLELIYQTVMGWPDTEREPYNYEWVILGAVPGQAPLAADYGDETYCKAHVAYRNAHAMHGIRWQAKRR